MTPAKRTIDDREWLIKHLTPMVGIGREISERDSSLPARP